MNLFSRVLVVFIFLIVCFDIHEARSAGPATPEALADEYIKAVNAKDKEALRSLFNPKCLENLSSLEKRFLEDILDNNFRSRIPEGRKVKAAKLEKGAVPFGDAMVWKVRPTHYFQIDFSTGENSGTSVIRFIAKDGGRWYMLMPFPNGENMKLYEEKIKRSGGKVEG